MALFDNLEEKAADIARNVGLTPEAVHAIAHTVLANLTSSDGNPGSAIQAAAAQHSVSITTVREIITLGGGLEGELGNFAGTLFEPGSN